MKRTFLIFTAILIASTVTMAQENILTLTGGYAWANLEDAEVDASGFRINGIYEYNPNEGKFSHGLAFGYIGTSADSAGAQGAEYKLNNWPIYYAPKLMIGKEKFTLFFRGALGMHFSSYKRTAALTEVKFSDTGFYGGLAVGLMFYVKDNVFINAEYEWAYLSNSYYESGFMNSANFGLGFRF